MAILGSLTQINVLPLSLNVSWTAILTTVVVAGATWLLYHLILLLKRIRTLENAFKDTPGPAGRHWLYGHLPLLADLDGAGRIKFWLELGSQFRRYFCFWVGPAKVTLVVNHPSTVKAVMKTSEPKPTGFSGMYRFGIPWLGRGLLISGGERWARSRRLLTPAFHFDILKPYVGVYNEAAEKMMANIQNYAEGKKPFEVFSLVGRCTLDVILRCAFSYETDCQKEGKPHPYLAAVSELSELWWMREKRFHLWFDSLFYLSSLGKRFKKQCDFVHTVAEEVIKKRKETLETSSDVLHGRKYLDFLDILLTAKDEHGEGMSLMDIRNEVDTFMFEGHDTTSSSISWILYALAKHPEYQEKVHEEIDSILLGREDDTIQWNDLNKMEYLTMCIKEGLRNYSPVPFIQREFTHDFEVDGRTYPKGTPVTLHIYGLHHNKDLWEKPLSYMPERFSKDNMAKMDPFQFVPFSAGPRNCIGQNFALNEEKVILARLFKRYKFSLDPTHIVKKKISAVMKSEQGIMMYATLR